MTAPAPAPAAACAPIIGASVARVTLGDRCGRPAWGPESSAVTDGFVSVEIAPSTEEGEDYKVRNANGEYCVNSKGADAVGWYDITIDFCRVDPYMFTMMQRSWKRVTEASRRTVTGWRQGEKISPDLGYSLELWPKVGGTGASQACLMGDIDSQDPQFAPSYYFLLPWVLASAPESTTIENSPTSFKMKGRTRAGSLWGRGPYNVTRDIDGNPAPLLDPIDPGFDVPAWGLVTSRDPDHWHTELVTVAPPIPTCGPVALWNPDATEPEVTITVAGGNNMSARITVDNWADVGRYGVVDWGDGAKTVMPSEGNGIAEHTYAAPTTGVQQVITFTPGNGGAPVISNFTPSA
jgi:hypothetical protein